MLTKVINVTKSFGIGRSRVDVLNGVSLDINESDYIAITGPSGCGKTTLLSIIGCLLKPTKGEVYYNKNKISDFSSSALTKLRSSEMGFVFQYTDMLPRLNVLENVLMPILFHDGLVSSKEQYAKNLLERLGLKDLIYSNVKNLSGGERQRIAIARSLINRPRILFADEPTGELDEKSAHLISRLFSEINAAGTTILLVTHNKVFADSAKNIYEMGKGRIQRLLK